MTPAHMMTLTVISIHALREEGDVMGYITIFTEHISIHALREEGDMGSASFALIAMDFYPRPPRGGRQRGAHYAKRRIEFLSTPSARRATTIAPALFCARTISIHALREEGDTSLSVSSTRTTRFLSTPSARRATNGHGRRPSAFADFYPRPPRGGRRARAARYSPLWSFLSTPSARRATSEVLLSLRQLGISIHALREEGDGMSIATDSEVSISIHALREEGDVARLLRLVRSRYFYPRPPRGGRRTLP